MNYSDALQIYQIPCGLYPCANCKKPICRVLADNSNRCWR